MHRYFIPPHLSSDPQTEQSLKSNLAGGPSDVNARILNVLIISRCSATLLSNTSGIYLRIARDMDRGPEKVALSELQKYHETDKDGVPSIIDS